MNTELRVEVALAIVRNPSSEGAQKFLITQRPKQAVLGGYWEFPGGKREADESIEQTVVREVREELGMDVVPVRAMAPIDHDYEHGQVRLRPFLCQWAGGTPEPLGVDRFVWVTVKELAAYRFPPANASLVEALVAEFAS